MNKTWVIAFREYFAAVKSKAFVVSLVLMPLMMFGGIIFQRMAAKISDVKPKHIAVIDRSPGGQIFGPLNEAAEQRNKNEITDKETGKQNKPVITLERVEPAPIADKDAVSRQELELSDRARREELFAFVEIGPDVLNPHFDLTAQSAEKAKAVADANMLKKMDLANELLGDNNAVRYCTARPTVSDVRDFLQTNIQKEVYLLRMKQAGLPYLTVMPLLTPPKLISYGLTRQDASGQIVNAERENELAAVLVPIALLMLMFLIVMVGASPLTANMIEEKQLRIAEVLLGSAKPFEILMGKLLGGVGVALTLAAVYFCGVLYFAKHYNLLDVVSPSVMVWFLIFMILSTLMYGSLFIAAGSAVTNVKEAQSMITPVILLIVMPLFVFESLLREPSGKLAMIGSFFPTSAPMVTIARLAIPPGVPMWQLLLSTFITLVTTIIIIWCAGRIFRVGILMQGQGAKIGEMMKWIVRG